VCRRTAARRAPAPALPAHGSGRAGRPRRPADDDAPVARRRLEAVGAQGLELARAVLGLGVAGRQPQAPRQADDLGAELGCKAVDLDQRLAIQPGRPLAAPGGDGIVVEARGAGEQEAAVASGRAARDGTGVDAGDGGAGVEQRSDRGEAGSAQADDADVGTDVTAQGRRVRPVGGIPPQRYGHRAHLRRPGG
jgi:hypothetical protein